MGSEKATLLATTFPMKDRQVSLTSSDMELFPLDCLNDPTEMRRDSFRLARVVTKETMMVDGGATLEIESGHWGGSGTLTLNIVICPGILRFYKNNGISTRTQVKSQAKASQYSCDDSKDRPVGDHAHVTGAGVIVRPVAVV